MRRVVAMAMLAGCPSANRPAWTVVEANSPAVPMGGETLAEPVGIETLGGVFTPLLVEGCPLPCTSTEVFSTAADNQDSISLFLYRGKGAPLVAEAVSLGQYEVVGISPAPRGVPQVAITFEARDGSIRIAAKESNRGSTHVIRRTEQ